MAKKEIRAKYIKNLIDEKANLSKVLEESTKESLTSILDESVNRQIREMLSESDEDSYQEEEVSPEDDVVLDDGQNTDADSDEESVIDLESGDDTENKKCDKCGCEDGSCDCDTEGDEVWNDIEDCKDSDGEYDLRGKSIDDVMRILKQMDPQDGVRIVKNDDETATVEPDGDETEFVISIDGTDDDVEANDFENDMDDEDSDDDEYIDIKGMGIDDIDDIEDEFDTSVDELESTFEDSEGDGETTFEVEIDDDDNEENDEEDMVNEGKINLGYTDNYQKKTAMTMPHDKGEGEGDSRFDAGAPKGDGKRWVGRKGANNGNPYTQKTKQPVSEMDECGDNTIFEVEMDDVEPVEESATTVTRGPIKRGVTNSRLTNRSGEQKDVTRNGHEDGFEKNGRGTGDGYAMAESRVAEIEKKANTIMNENKEMRAILAQFKDKLNEAVVINSSLAKVIKLLTENSTTREEKINILNRFNTVQSLTESRNLYKQISSELKEMHSVNKSNLLNNQLTEAKSTNKNMIVETNMLGVSEELQRIIDLQNRMENK